MFPSVRRLAAAAAVALGLAAAPALADPVTLTDIAGRSVTLPAPARRVVLSEGRQVVALALLDREPVKLLAGWGSDLRKRDVRTYALFKTRFPAIDDVPVVGEGGDETFSAESAIALKPDLVVLSGRAFGQEAASSEVVRQLDAAGIPVIFVDFFAHPFENTLPSIAILGKALGREAQAADYTAFYKMHMDRIASRVAKLEGPRPKVLLEAHASPGSECCNTPGRGSIGDFITFAGGHNIATDVVKGTHGRLNLEYVIAENPTVYIATGGPHLEKTGGLVLGPGYEAERIRASLAGVVARPGIADIAAVREGNVHGVYHNLINLPINVVVAEALARWIHPELFADVDPAATLAEINARFLAVPFEGVYWTDLK